MYVTNVPPHWGGPWSSKLYSTLFYFSVDGDNTGEETSQIPSSSQHSEQSSSAGNLASSSSMSNELSQ